MALAGTPLYPCDRDRLGFGVVYGIQNYDVAPLQAGWYVNWGATSPTPHPAGLDYTQIIRTGEGGYSPTGSNLAALIASNPGSLWLIGNEPDCPYQDNVTPRTYARLYHDAYQEIKSRDPFAQVAIGGIVQATPLRLQWLEQVWNEYLASYGQPMPVDVWNVHAFVLREVRPGHGGECRPAGSSDFGEWGASIPPGLTANCGLWIGVDELDRLDLFQQQIVRFRTWMRDHGQQNKPLVISEYGILFNEELGYNYQRVRDYLLATFDYFLNASDPALGYPADANHLVQRWAWYSLDDTSFVWGTTHSALMDRHTRQLLPLGYEFARYASRLSCPAYVDLQPIGFGATTPAAVRYGETGTVQLALQVRNQGNAAAGPSQVRFWDGDPDAGGVSVGTVDIAAVPARYQGTITATLDWPAAAQGNHTLTAQVDASGQIAESREDNNRYATALNFGAVNLAVGASSWRLEHGPLRAGEATQLWLAPVAVTLTRPISPTAGLDILPPSFQATWYNANPAAGGQPIASRTIAAPSRFDVTLTVPAQAWAPVVTASLTPWFAVSLAGGAAETTLNDNATSLNIPASTDLTLIAVQRVGGIPLAPEGGTADVTIRFRARNLGILAPGVPVQVGIWAGSGPAGASLGRVPLEATGDWTVPWTWPGLAIGAYPFVGLVDPDGAIPDTNRANNQLADIAMVAKVRYYLPVDLRLAAVAQTRSYLPVVSR